MKREVARWRKLPKLEDRDPSHGSRKDRLKSRDSQYLILHGRDQMTAILGSQGSQTRDNSKSELNPCFWPSVLDLTRLQKLVERREPTQGRQETKICIQLYSPRAYLPPFSPSTNGRIAPTLPQSAAVLQRSRDTSGKPFLCKICPAWTENWLPLKSAV